MVTWQWSSFEELSRDDLFNILKARQAVFIVEQNCVYQDVDDLDPLSWHLLGWLERPASRLLVAYSRIIFPGKKFAEPALGRVLTTASVRGTGLGTELTLESIARTMRQYPESPIRISAQRYLEKFYARFGFETVSAPYDEDGIAHIEMLRQATGDSADPHRQAR